MRGAILAGAMAAVLTAPAQAGEPQLACFGQASGANGEAVDVTLYLTPKGERIGSHATWDPPRIDQPMLAKADVPALSFSMMYHNPGPDGLGKAGDPLIWASAFAPPDKRGRSNPERQFAGLGLELTLDNAPPQMLPLTINELLAPLPMTAWREARVAALPATTQTVTIRLLRNGKQPVATARYDLTGFAARDRLFATAWQAAETAALTPDTCERTLEAD